MAKLYFRYGAMGSSKTANAIMVQYNYQERGQKALMLKPQLDKRDACAWSVRARDCTPNARMSRRWTRCR